MSWDDAPLPYQSLDADGHLVEVNSHWCEFSGYTAEEARGAAYQDFVPPGHIDYFHETFALFAEQGVLNGRDCYFQRKDGEIRRVLIYGRMTRDADGAVISHCMLVDVTAKRQIEQELADSEARYRSLFELAPNPVVVHDGREIVIANDAAARFLGYETARDLVGVEVSNLVHPDSLPLVAERVGRMMTSDWIAPLTVEQFVRRDGSTVYGETIASPVMVGGRRVIHVAAIDLTARRAAEQALEESEDRFRQLFDAAPDGIVVHDGTAVRFVNPAALKYFGLPEGLDISGFKVDDFIHPDSLQTVHERLARLAAGAPTMPPLEVHLKRADGSMWEAEVSSTLVALDGERLVQTTFRDLAERRRTELELARYRTELERLVDERTRSLHRVKAELESITAVIARTVELRDPYTAGHQRRVAELSVALAVELGMTDDDVDTIRVAAAMHDIGKVSVPAEILSKPGRFSAIEFELVKTHAQAGFEILSSAELGRPVAEIVHQHHERLDGTGYPRGIAGDQLLPGARVLMVADVVEAMSSHRPYRPAIGQCAALEEISAGRGVRYDPTVVDACLALMERGFEFTDES